MSRGHSNCVEYTDPFYLISDLINVYQNYYYVTASNTLVFFFLDFWLSMYLEGKTQETEIRHSSTYHASEFLFSSTLSKNKIKT